MLPKVKYKWFYGLSVLPVWVNVESLVHFTYSAKDPDSVKPVLSLEEK